MPREVKFFDLFQKSADLSLQAAHEFRAMLDHLPEVEAYASRIRGLEEQADQISHQTLELLHDTFITPLDREDIHHLTNRLDDIIDFLKAAAERLRLYEMKEVGAEARTLADFCVLAIGSMKKAVDQLDDLSDPQAVRRHCVEVNRIENEADNVFREASARLLREAPDFREFIKHKEILEILETVTDHCEDVAQVIEGIVLEYA
jgi:hypothetical protein